MTANIISNIDYILRLYTDNADYSFGSDPGNTPQKEILYCKMSFEIHATQLKFTVDSPDTGYYDRTDIDQFIKDLYDSTKTMIPNRPMVHYSPLDIELKKPCYVVVELDRGWNWRFLPSHEALKTRDNHVSDYCGLHYVADNAIVGSTVGSIKPAPQDKNYKCKIVYFTAVNVPPVTLPDQPGHPFNLYIEFDQGDKALPIVIDPDIKNTGPPTTMPPPATSRSGRSKKA